MVLTTGCSASGLTEGGPPIWVPHVSHNAGPQREVPKGDPQRGSSNGCLPIGFPNWSPRSGNTRGFSQRGVPQVRSTNGVPKGVPTLGGPKMSAPEGSSRRGSSREVKHGGFPKWGPHCGVPQGRSLKRVHQGASSNGGHKGFPECVSLKGVPERGCHKVGQGASNNGLQSGVPQEGSDKAVLQGWPRREFPKGGSRSGVHIGGSQWKSPNCVPPTVTQCGSPKGRLTRGFPEGFPRWG